MTSVRARTRSRYGWPLIGLHWLTFLLIVVVYATAELSDAFPKGSAGRSNLRAGHEMLGLLVLVLVLVLALVGLRIAVRGFSAAPAIVPAPPRWQAQLATAAHLALYGLMIVLPLVGWLMLSAAGKSVPFFAWELPPLLAPSRPLAKVLEDVHEAVASVGYALIGLHAVAALFHHTVVCDDTLRRMLPGRGSALR